MAPSPIRVHVALLTVSLLFGANYVFSKQILAEVPLRAWVQFRMTAAMCLLVGLALWSRLRRNRDLLRKRGLPNKSGSPKAAVAAEANEHRRNRGRRWQ